MDNQAKNFIMEKDGARLSREKMPKESQKMQEKKKTSSWKKRDLRIACKKCIYLSFLNLKSDIFLVSLNKLNILLELHFDLHLVSFYCLACSKNKLNNLKYTHF